MPAFTEAIGQISDVSPTRFSSFAVGSNIALSANAIVRFFRNPIVSTFQFAIVLEVNDSAGTNILTQTTSGSDQNSASGEIVWGPIAVNGTHSNAAAGWYYATWTLSIRKQNANGTWGSWVTLDSDGTIYKVGSPTANIPYATSSELAPCDRVLAKGGTYEATGAATVRVLDNPTGDRFSFKFFLRVLNPAGTQVAQLQKGPVTVGGGGETRFKDASITFGPTATNTEGRWTTQIYITAQNIDQIGAAEQTILNHWCRFEIKDTGSSSSSSSSP